MTDPVRPVAPELPPQWNCPYCGYGEYKNRDDWKMRVADHLHYCDQNPSFAAAPVLCAASPADDLITAAWSVIDCWGVGSLNITAMTTFVEQLRDALLRATGEGARDADRDVVLRSDSMDAARSDASTSPSTQTPPPSTPDAPPVAVSLDPHRLLKEWFDQAHDETIHVFNGIEGMTSPRDAAKQAADYMLEVLLARLRGEATVRVEEND